MCSLIKETCASLHVCQAGGTATTHRTPTITKTVHVCPPHTPERILQRGGGARTVHAEYQPEVTRTETDKQRGGQQLEPQLGRRTQRTREDGRHTGDKVGSPAILAQGNRQPATGSLKLHTRAGGGGYPQQHINPWPTSPKGQGTGRLAGRASAPCNGEY